MLISYRGLISTQNKNFGTIINLKLFFFQDSSLSLSVELLLWRPNDVNFVPNVDFRLPRLFLLFKSDYKLGLN